MLLGRSVLRQGLSVPLSGVRRSRCFHSAEGMQKLAQALDRDPALALELVENLSKDSRIRMANTILDQEAKTGVKYSDYLASRHRKKIMIREMSISMGQELKDSIDVNHDGQVTPEELNSFLENLMKTQSGKMKALPPSNQQLWQLALLSGIPFIGFGFLDNAIMLIAGDIIDTTIGRMLGISTLAAAALGNLISDVAGLGLGGYIEASAKQLGLKDPRLSLQQMNTRQVRILQFIATSIGISIGCLLGMLPLLFMDPEENDMKEMFETMDTDENGKVQVHQLVNMISENADVLGQAQTAGVLKRIEQEFPDTQASIEYGAFRDFVVKVREEKIVAALSPKHQFIKQFTDAVGCHTNKEGDLPCGCEPKAT